MIPDDYYITDAVDPDAVARHARNAVVLTGRPQRIHDHPIGERCRDRCRAVGA